MKYIRELDSIRGVGIIMVVMFHWIPVDSFYNTFPNRPFGVDVFFVLSGFLITNILLNARLAAEAQGIPKRLVFINFFSRRALRIFPIYFLVVALILAGHEWLGASMRQELVPALTYTLNFHFYQHQYWGDLTTHLWTLSIEEQFYLVWPFIILLTNKKYLLPIIAAFILTGVVSQLLITDHEFGYLPSNTCFDAFGIGALISWIRTCKPSLLGRTYSILKILGIISLIILIAGAAYPDVVFLSPQRTLRSLVAAWAITFVVYRDHISDLQDTPLFSSRILMFIGRISYGMYLYHIFLPWMYHIINAPINEMLPAALSPYMIAITFVENFLMLILISWTSYRFIERPIMNIKKSQRISARQARADMRAAVA